MDTETCQQVLKDHEFYATLVEHRKNYLRLSGVDYDTLHHSTISFIPTRDVIEMFRQDYTAMQAAMIYGPSPDFNTMISQLKLLAGRFRLINEYHILENIIKHAVTKIDSDKSFEREGATFSTPVTYFSDLNKKAEPTNKTVTYTVQFTWNGDKWVFENITIN